MDGWVWGSGCGVWMSRLDWTICTLLPALLCICVTCLLPEQPLLAAAATVTVLPMVRLHTVVAS